MNEAIDGQSVSTETMLRNAAETSGFIVSVADGACDIDSAANDALHHGQRVTEAGDAVSSFAERLKARCTILLHQNELGDRRKHERLPCQINVTLKTPSASIKGQAFDISSGGMLVRSADDSRIRDSDSIEIDIEGLGQCQTRIIERSKTGIQIEFVQPSEAVRDAIENRLWAIREENSEFVARAMEAGKKVCRRFESGLIANQVTLDDLFDADYQPVPDTDPVQFTTRALSWFEKNLPDILEPLLATDSRMTFCAAVDRNGYLPVHNKIYSQPQHAGDAAWNAANCRNRRIFDDRARACRRAQHPRLSHPVLSARHGQRTNHHDARNRRADPDQRHALGRVAHRVQALTRLLRALRGGATFTRKQARPRSAVRRAAPARRAKPARFCHPSPPPRRTMSRRPPPARTGRMKSCA